MSVDWTPHRFSGGVLALDVTNTVVHRNRPDLRFDRFDDAAEIARFAAAAQVHRAMEIGGQALHTADRVEMKPVVVAIRETTDALFRDAAVSGGLKPSLLAPFLRAAADAMALSPLEGEMPAGQRGSAKEAPQPSGTNPSATLSGLPATSPSRGERTIPRLHFETALGFSALSLLPPETHRRIRVCPNCAWLFLDRSRNRSRTWCDMAVCGNRSKARRHYRKRRIGEADDADVSKG